MFSSRVRSNKSVIVVSWCHWCLTGWISSNKWSPVILESKMQLDNPLAVGMGHYVSFLPEKCWVWSFNHLIFGQKFHGIHLNYDISFMKIHNIFITFFVNLCLTNWTSPKAPLPMTLIRLKSSVFIRHWPISEDTSASKIWSC